MPTITVPRGDVTSDEVVKALRDGLDRQYTVRAGLRLPPSSFLGLQEAPPDDIVVSSGASTVWRAQVRITREAGQTSIQVSPGGLAGPYLVNTFGIVRKVQRALLAAPGFGPK